MLLGLVRRGLGGTAGAGRQYVSWIHDQDFVRAIAWLIARDDIAGPTGTHAAAWMLEIGARALQTETEPILESRRVVPGRLLNAGFTFDYPLWPEAAQNLCQRWRSMRPPGR